MGRTPLRVTAAISLAALFVGSAATTGFAAEGVTTPTPIEGTPPDLASGMAGCPFAPRCMWRIERCWSDDPAIAALPGDVDGRAIACHHPPADGEGIAGRPLDPAFRPAPPPPEVAARIAVVVPVEAGS